MTKLTERSDLDRLTILGQEAGPQRKLETFPNHHPDREYVVTLSTREFTCLCPVTGQPDFARITIKYSPGERVLESKSLKLYLWSFRDERTFHEHFANVLLDDLVEALSPRWCRVVASFAPRGGIPIRVAAEYRP